MYWANFLHIYQPPTQSKAVVKAVCNESYLPLVSGLEKTPLAKLTLNISGSLTELLVECGFGGLVKRIAQLAKSGQIELTGSAKYHPILPLLPEAEIIRQINLNFATNRKYFGSDYNPAGFFPPEMAYSEKLGQILAKLGFKWVLIDEIVGGALEKMALDKVFYQKENENLKLLLRSRRISNFVARAKAKSGRQLVSGIKMRAKNQKFVITALDGETFGHHNKGYEQILFDAYGEKKLTAVTLSKLIALADSEELIKPQVADWSTSEFELKSAQSFNLWHNPHNTLHRLQWQLTHLAIKKIEAVSKKDPGYPIGRHLLDCGLHSDQYWWASGKIIFGSFLLWSVEMIEAGARGLMQSIDVLKTVDKKTKDKTHQLYDKILATAFNWQRKGVIVKRREMISKRLASRK